MGQMGFFSSGLLSLPCPQALPWGLFLLLSVVHRLWRKCHCSKDVPFLEGDSFGWFGDGFWPLIACISACVHTHTHARTYSAEELGYPSWGTQTLTCKRTHNYWVLGIHRWVRGAFGQFHLRGIHLPVPLASQPVPHISACPWSMFPV